MGSYKPRSRVEMNGISITAITMNVSNCFAICYALFGWTLSCIYGKKLSQCDQILNFLLFCHRVTFIQQRYLTGVFRDCLFTTFLVEGINKASPFQSRWPLQIMKKHSFFRRAMYLQSLPMTLFPKLTFYRTLPMLDWITNQISGWVLPQMLDRWINRLSWQTFL